MKLTIAIPFAPVAKGRPRMTRAGRAYTGTWDAREWYAKERDRIILHDDSRALVERLLAEPAKGRQG